MKKNNLWFIVSLVLFLVIVILGILMILPKFAPKSSNDIKSDNPSGETNKAKENQKNSDEKFSKEDALELLNKFGFNLTMGCGATILDYEYDDNFKGLVALENVPSINHATVSCTDAFTVQASYDNNLYQGETGVCMKDETLKMISYDDANSVYQSLFNIDMPKHSFAGKNNLYIFYDYVESKDSFVSMKCHGCGGSCGSSLKIFEILDSNLNQSVLSIDVANYFDIDFFADGGNYHLVTNQVDENIACSSLEDCKDVITKDYLNKLNLYTIVFEKSKNGFILKNVVEK